MGRKFKVYLDSGANIHSKYETEVDLEDFDIESDEWDDMSEEEQQETMREVAWERAEWGWEEIK
jgi:Ran GTPase-activating protein (RanGAP) involved in mRNA processing and transport